MQPDRQKLFANIHKSKFKRIIATALILWTGYLGQVNAQEKLQPIKTPESKPLILDEYSFADVFAEQIAESSEGDLQDAMFSLITNLYSTMPADELSSDQIPDELKALIAQSILQRISGHGDAVTATSEHILRYFNQIDGKTSVIDNTDKFDIRNLFDEESIKIQKFENEELGKRGIRILFDVSTDKLDKFVKESKTEILNASFTVGTHQLIIYTEEKKPAGEFILEFIGDDDLYVAESGYDMKVDSDGILKPYKNGEFLRLYSEQEVQELQRGSGEWAPVESNYELIEPYYSPVSEEDDRFTGALDLGTSNREKLYKLAERNPGTIFVVAAGNYNSNSKISATKPSNVIFVGMLFFSKLLPGEADIVIDYAKFNGKGLSRLNEEGSEDKMDSSSEATAVISSILAILKKENPDLSPKDLINKLYADFSTIQTIEIRYNREAMGVAGNEVTLKDTKEIRELDVDKLILELE